MKPKPGPAPAEVAQIVLVANAPGAQFFFDGDFDKPCASPCLRRGATGAEQNIVVRANGYDELSKSIRIERNGQKLRFELDRRAGSKSTKPRTKSGDRSRGSAKAKADRAKTKTKTDSAKTRTDSAKTSTDSAKTETRPPKPNDAAKKRFFSRMNEHIIKQAKGK